MLNLRKSDKRSHVSMLISSINVISLINLAQRLKVLLGGVLVAMPTNDGEDDETRRRLTAVCEDADNGACTDDTKVSCEDPKFLCGGTNNNWNYVAFLKLGENSTVSPICFPICLSVLLLTHHEFSLSY